MASDSKNNPQSRNQVVDELFILARIAQAEEAALGELYDRYAKIIYSMARQSLNSIEESEEIVLDVFSQVWRTAGQYDPKKGRVDTWLFMIARSRILDRLRSLQRSTKKLAASIDSYLQSPATTPDPLDHVVISERRAVVISALAQLSPKQRQALELSYYKGLSHPQIAKEMELSLGTVKSSIRLGLNKLRAALENSSLRSRD